MDFSAVYGGRTRASRTGWTETFFRRGNVQRFIIEGERREEDDEEYAVRDPGEETGDERRQNREQDCSARRTRATLPAGERALRGRFTRSASMSRHRLRGSRRRRRMRARGIPGNENPGRGYAPARNRPRRR